MTPADPLLARALTAHQAGRLKEAAAGYKSVLRKRPNDPDALHFFGLLHFQRGEGVAAVKLIMQSLARAPANPHAWNNLGNILIAQDKIAEAKEAYRRVTLLAPTMAEVWFNLAICLRDEGEFDTAVQHFRTAIQHRPDYVRAYEHLGKLLYRTGDFSAAGDAYARWLALEPDNPVARHMVAATTGVDVPARADDEYVAKVFDRFADSFDHNLKHLGYRAPELVASALAHWTSRRGASEPVATLTTATTLDILDAGCGTGLCAPLLKPLAHTLVGVDLSAKMIDHARARGGYQELVVAELVGFMQSRPSGYDAVISADTLVYFGPLDQACEAAHHALRPGGLFIYTVEALPADSPEEHVLNVHGRYAHGESYVRRTLVETGFEVLEVRREVLRMERLQEVIGLLVVARSNRARD